ncbi:hypothetical protein [Pseudomonas gozinkensis]|uniref:hypothetical protein n=1 Tax=Pseudomonas gozinkensis TaxID=2774461 RepID=UPI0017889690|nr:hypothetical protein [Pseudomonas gozinkensis]
MAVSSIKEINDKFSYDDKVSGGEGDGVKVSCGQHGSYNELSYIYTTLLQPLIDKKKITKQEALDALDEACDLPQPRMREAYYDKLEELLGVAIR